MYLLTKYQMTLPDVLPPIRLNGVPPTRPDSPLSETKV
jgi:hypothetical protein